MIGITVPLSISKAPWAVDPKTGSLVSTGAAFDLISMIGVVIVTAVLVKGIKESARCTRMRSS